MNYKLADIIDQIKDQIKVITEEEHKKNNAPIIIPPESCIFINRSSNNISKNNEFDRIMEKQHKINNHGKISNIKEDVSKLADKLIQPYDPRKNLLEDINLTSFQKPWTKLDNELKINRAMKFVNEQIELNKLNDIEGKKLRILIINAINTRKITKLKDVVYNEKTGLLEKINDLEYDAEKKFYYFKSNITNVPTGTTKLSTTQTQFLKTTFKPKGNISSSPTIINQ
jgi:hypothetical protein